MLSNAPGSCTAATSEKLGFTVPNSPAAFVAAGDIPPASPLAACAAAAVPAPTKAPLPTSFPPTAAPVAPPAAPAATLHLL